MIADELTIIEEKVKVDLILSLLDSLSLDALEGFGEERSQADSLSNNAKHLGQTIMQALRDTREVLRESSGEFRPLPPQVTNAIRDAERMALIERLAQDLTAAKEHREALVRWLSSGAIGRDRPSADKQIAFFGRVAKETRRHVDSGLRAAIADYEKTNEQTKNRRTGRT